MKSVNRVLAAAGLGSLLGVTGCLSTVKPPAVELALDGAAPAQLLDTATYIPRRLTDEETGQLLPYEPALNPYTALKGRIPAKHVQTFVRARQAFQLGDLSGSQQLLEQLTAADSDLSGPWVMLGDIAVQQRRSEAAVSSYARAIAINEVNINAYLKLAKVQRVRGHFIQAQNTYAKALSVWPDFPEAHLNLAILYDIYLNRPLQAQRHLESYQFLTGGRDKVRAQWLAEIQQRTGAALELEPEVAQAVSVSSSGI